MLTCRSRSTAARYCARSPARDSANQEARSGRADPLARDAALTRLARVSTFAWVLGERFGSFRALSRLGEGSMGEVYLAEHQRIARRAAIKVLSPERTRDA